MGKTVWVWVGLNSRGRQAIGVGRQSRREQTVGVRARKDEMIGNGLFGCRQAIWMVNNLDGKQFGWDKQFGWEKSF